MAVPIKALTQFQKMWYARMVIAAILADGEISQPETEFIKHTLDIFRDPKDRNELLSYISKRVPPPISEPIGFHPEVLAAIFVELCLIIISDLEMSPKERDFLQELAEQCKFAKEYYLKLIKWCEAGLGWKNSQSELRMIDGGECDHVPVAELSTKQQFWYAQVLIGTIMSDGELDRDEVSFVKMALSFVQDPRLRKQLAAYISNHTSPPLTKPPELSRDILVQIFIEVMLIVSADEVLGAQEIVYLKKLSDLCGFPKELHDQLVRWCELGVRWKQARNPLISQVKVLKEPPSSGYLIFRRESDSTENITIRQGGDGKVPVETKRGADTAVKTGTSSGSDNEKDLKNSSLIEYDMGCFICSSTDPVKVFHLKVNSHKVSNNIFGIPGYVESNSDFDYIDYNLCKVIICPSCHFASTQKALFRKDEKSVLPDLLKHQEISSIWLQGVESRKEQLAPLQSELDKHKRSLPAVVKSYQTAIKSANLIAKLNNSIEMKWYAITLKLTMADILMRYNKGKQSEQVLSQIGSQAKDLFDRTSNNQISFRSARFLFLFSVYNSDFESARTYYLFLDEVKKSRLDKLTQEEQVLFKKIFGEIHRAYERREDYVKEKLDGFNSPV
ncbi:MAG: TerB family tellurite resistance protein [Proteobacteria bacterium]|nr:TerB family tellurite resistance protein [Pseudomonadota bacterium]